MKTAIFGAGAVVLVLAGCSPQVPDSNPRGAGFENYNDFTTYRTQRDAELNGGQPATSVPPASGAANPVATTGTPSASTTPAGPVEVNNPGISDEQNFDAVANRQSIESDAARIQRNREARQVIEPTAVPTRTSSGPNVVEYAISTSNPVGVKAYRRGVSLNSRKFETNCAKYDSADLAQEAFLAAGGPKRDKLGMDPDGDGFACAWNPNIYRQIARKG